MPQTNNYTLLNTGAVPGMIVDGHDDSIVVQWVASEVIPFGVAVELDSTGTKVQLPKQIGTNIAQPAGISMYPTTYEPNATGYQIGDLVEVVRKGRVAVTTVGTAIAQTDALTAANVSHSSTTATDRGKFTKSATSGTAGSEIGDIGVKWIGPTGITNLAIVEINLP